MKKKKGKTAGTGVEKDDKEQSQRFVETAKELEVDESGAKFEKAIKKIESPKNPD